MYCDYCESENCEHLDRTCPACGGGIDVNCPYDTPMQRHIKNLMNGKSDEEWVIKGITLRQGDLENLERPERL